MQKELADVKLAERAAALKVAELEGVLHQMEMRLQERDESIAWLRKIVSDMCVTTKQATSLLTLPPTSTKK